MKQKSTKIVPNTILCWTKATEVAQLRKINLLKATENEKAQREIQAERRKAFEECLKEVQIAWMQRAGQIKKINEAFQRNQRKRLHFFIVIMSSSSKSFSIINNVGRENENNALSLED